MAKIEENVIDIKNSSVCSKKVAKKVIRIIFIVLMLLILSLSYIFMFSGSSKNGLFGAFAVGVIEEENFENANAGDLIIIDKVDDITSIKKDNIVVYKINGNVESSIVLEISETNNILKLQRNGEIDIISFDLILGLQGGKIGFLGYIWGFITSITGVIVLSLLFLGYVFYITFSRVNEEETIKGKQLLSAYKEQKKQKQIRERLLSQFRKTDGFSAEDSVIIDGSMGDNLIELVAFTSAEKKGDISSTYKYILEKVHRSYMFKDKLSKIDKIRISNVIEMCPIVDKFDEDMEYKLTDLILREQVQEFDLDGFEKLSLKFLSKDVKADDLDNFGSVLYVLLSKTEKLRQKNFKNVAIKYQEKINEKFSDYSDLILLSEKILEMFKHKTIKK